MYANLGLFNKNENTATNTTLQTITITHPKIERTEPSKTPRLDLYDYTNGKLNVFTSQGLETLSISRDDDDVSITDNNEKAPGINYSIPALKMSPNGDYLYYCEQQTKEENYCVGYVYSFIEEVLYPMFIEDTAFTITNDLANEVAWQEQEGSLYLGNMRSLDTEKPWLLGE